MEMIGHAVWVWAALALTLIVPAWMTAFRLTPPHARWQMLLTALVLGLASQGLLGLVWDRWVRTAPLGEMAVYYGFWAAMSLGMVFCKRTRKVAMPLSRTEGFWLAGILLAAWVVRTLHPLAHAALGQSDAYSHLQFIRQAAGEGMIHNQIYPPAYSWIMALPVMTFGMDPYWIARFGGAFWGMGLVLAVFALGWTAGRRGTGWLAAVAVAFCPLWMPLIKTGVGAFANQAGLFWIPMILLAALRMDERRMAGLLLVGSLSLAATVPIMWISLMPVLMVERLVSCREVRWGRRTLRMGLLLLPGFLLLLGQAARIQDHHREATVAIVTHSDMAESAPSLAVAEPALSEPPSAAIRLLTDYVSIKRRGYGRPLLNGLALGLAGAFAVILWLGIRRRRPEWRLLGAWGLVTSLQAGTGCLQFSGYQREGWSLMLATAWLGGVTGAAVLASMKSRWVKTGLVGIGVLSVLGWCAAMPPSHPPAFSEAEDEWIEGVRRLAAYAEDHPDEPPLVLVTRPFLEFQGDQGNPVSAVLPLGSRLGHFTVTEGSVWNPDSATRFLVLMDTEPLAGSAGAGLFAQVQPGQVEQFHQTHLRLFGINRQLKQRLSELPAAEWRQQAVPLKGHLLAVRVQAQGAQP